MIDRWNAFWTVPNRWARNNPWQWAIGCAVVWFVGGWAVSDNVGVGVIVAAAGLVITGLSVGGFRRPRR
jgi:hypothetical protein